MVTKRKQHSSKRPVKQGRGARARRPIKIGASTPYHFRGKNLTPYGGLLPVATTRHDGTGENGLQSLPLGYPHFAKRTKTGISFRKLGDPVSGHHWIE